MGSANKIIYFAHIDGLRFLAVTSVILYHFFPHSFTSGFLGVDVFFVISGFVISKVLLDKDHINLKDFFVRRVNRLFPAFLLFMMFAFIISAVFINIADRESIYRDAVAAQTFWSNFNFLYSVNYFQRDFAKSVFLHTWSLSIEEQFYVLFSLLLFIVFFIGIQKYFKIILISLFLISIYLYLAENNLSQKFYSPENRWWEILFGCMLYVFHGIPRKVPSLYYVIPLSVLVILIFLPFGHENPYLNLIAVCLTGLLIITSAKDKYIFENGISTLLGRISYPAYLFHFPLAVIWAHFLPERIPGFGSDFIPGLLILITFALAYITYRYVETPIRRAHNNSKTTIALLSMALLFTSMNFYSWKENKPYLPDRGLVERPQFGGEIGNLSFFKRLTSEYLDCEDQFFSDRAVEFEGYLRCFQSQPGTQFDHIVLGDSNAEHLFWGVAKRYPNDNVLSAMGNKLPHYRHEYYRDFVKYLENMYIKPKTVYISSYWQARLSNQYLGKEYSVEDLPTTLINKIESIGIDVVVITGVPSFLHLVQKCNFNNILSPPLPMKITVLKIVYGWKKHAVFILLI